MTLSLVEFNGYNGKVWSDDRILLVKLAGAMSPSGSGTSVQYLGAVGGIAVPVSVIPVLTVHATYVANDYVGTDHTAMIFPGASRIPGGSGYIVNAVLEDNVSASVSGELWMFRSAPAGLPDDSAAFTITDADARECIGIIPFNTYYASALNSIAMGDIKIPIGFTCAVGSTSLYGAFVTRGAPGYTANDLQFRLFFEQY
jgi:hypothetical protein